MTILTTFEFTQKYHYINHFGLGYNLVTHRHSNWRS